MNEINDENILAIVTREALACTRAALNARRATRERVLAEHQGLKCELCIAGEHSHDWVLTDQKCSCSCHQPKAAPAAMTLQATSASMVAR